MNFFKILDIQPTQQTERKLGTLFSALDSLLSEHSEHDVKFIAGFSGLLGKVAYADREIADEELELIRTILTEGAEIPPAVFDSLLSLVREHTESLAGIEDSRYIQILNEISTPNERVAIMRSLFAVAAADGSIDSDEERELALIAKGFRMSASSFSGLRSEFREQLAVLKPSGG